MERTLSISWHRALASSSPTVYAHHASLRPAVVQAAGVTRCTLYHTRMSFYGGDHGEEGLSHPKPRTADNNKHSTRDTRHTPHTHACHTEHSSTECSGITSTKTEKDAPKKGLDVSTTLGCPRKSHCISNNSDAVPVAACMYHTIAETPSFTDRRVR